MGYTLFMVIVTSLSEYQNVKACREWNPINSSSTHFSRLYYVWGGEAYYFDHDSFFRFEPGHLYLLPSNKAYRLNHNPNNPIDHLYCHITTSPLITSVIDVKVEEGSLLFQAISLLKNNIKSDNFHIVLKMVDLIVSLMLQTSSQDDPLIDDPAHLIKNYIDQNYKEDISLDSLAEHLHFSKQHIIRLFQKTYNLSPIKYLMQLRLEAALHYLRNGETINNISNMLHYSNPANFSLSFKKYYGLAPTEYLKMLREDNQYSKTFLPPKE